MFLAYIRLIFRGSFVEITTAILLVYKILKKSVRCIVGILRILYTNNLAVVISTKEPLKMSLI
jgi:hypothetical protein